MAKVYIAAPFSDKDKMPEIAAKLEARGVEITHKWWEIETTNGDFWLKQRYANMDADGVRNCDYLLLINSAKSEGKAVEQGIAIGLGKQIIAVGKRGEYSKNVFHWLDNYIWIEDLDDAIELLGKSAETIRWAFCCGHDFSYINDPYDDEPISAWPK